MIATATIPMITPARIDSNGKPGIGGSVIGVETELVEVLTTVVEVVGVLTAVVVITEELSELVTTVVVIELVVIGVDEVEVEMLDVVEAALVVLLVGVDDVEVVADTPPGGSRCRTKSRLDVLPKICEPTASPLVPERSDIPNRIPGGGIEGVSNVLQVFVPIS